MVSEETVNARLIRSKSPYLKSAAHQPVNWFEWSDEAFRKAQTEDKPILLDIGAVWCHWCHVIDRESYENKEIAEIINAYFVPIKVDRDERPDIDARYQKAVSAISGQGGWPLTAFLTPQGEVFYGGTYFPPEDRGGFPGIKKVLKRVHDVYREKKEHVYEDAKKISLAVSMAEKNPIKKENPSIAGALQNMESEFDPDFGGFGNEPKFPSDTALKFLLECGSEKGQEKYLRMAMMTLEAMYKGGIRDQLGGAFHRYSVDRLWKVPHFEIMLYVNAGMLDVYSDAYRLTQNPVFKKAALGIIQYVFDELAHRDTGGFSASQDADVSLEDDGDYYTWSLAEVLKQVDGVTFEAIKQFYDIGEEGEMTEKPERNVLFMAQDAQAIAKDLKISEKEAEAYIQKGIEVLRLERRHRKKPIVDATIYVNWNALMTEAFFAAFKAFGLEECKNFALKTLDFLMENAYEEGRGMAHIYSESAGTFGLFDDQIQTASALLHAYELTGQKKYMADAVKLTDFCLSNFWDKTSKGFYDVIFQEEAAGLLSIPNKTFEDSPTPASNASAVLVLDELYHLTGQEKYRTFAEETLQAFPASAEYGVYTASFARAVRFHSLTPCRVVIVGDPADPEYRFLLWAAHQVYRPGKIVLPIDFNGGHDMMLADEFRGYLKVKDASELPLAYVCAGQSCAAPTQEVSELKHLISTFGLPGKPEKGSN